MAKKLPEGLAGTESILQPGAIIQLQSDSNLERQDGRNLTRKKSNCPIRTKSDPQGALPEPPRKIDPREYCPSA
jgi:hypothetical protein